MKQILIFLLIVINSLTIFAASELTFNSSAQPTSLILGGTDLLGTEEDAAGFFLKDENSGTRLFSF